MLESIFWIPWNLISKWVLYINNSVMFNTLMLDGLPNFLESMHPKSRISWELTAGGLEKMTSSCGAKKEWSLKFGIREEVVQVWDDMKTLASPPSCQSPPGFFHIFKFGNPDLNLPLATVNWVGGRFNENQPLFLEKTSKLSWKNSK